MHRAARPAFRGLASVLLFTLMVGCGGGGGSGDAGSPAPSPSGSPPTTNTAPVAAAGAAQSVAVGSLVVLQGSAVDAEGDTLTFAWTMILPAGSAAVLSDPTSPQPSFIADVSGDYEFTLVVSDGRRFSPPSTSRVVAASSSNVPPVANIGAPAPASVGTTVTLEGGASADADGDVLSFDWILSSRPVGSAATLAAPSSARPTFVADVAGAYVATLVVSDGLASSSPASITVSAMAAASTAPIANAGPSQIVTTGSTVTLDGSTSLNPSGGVLFYSWALISRPGGSAASLSTLLSVVRPTFVADVPGTYLLQLYVTDATGVGSTATVAVTAMAGNAVPVANAGTAQNVVAGSTVTLNGSASSDANGDPLSFAWTLTARPGASTAAMSSASSAMPGFVADLPGTYVASLVVSDGALASTAATVTVTAAIANVAPVASAGTAQNVVVGSTVTLNGSASSDANGDGLTFAWSLTGRPNGSSAALSSTASALPTFVADVPGTYVASLVVSDGRLVSTTATVAVTAAIANVAPVANAGTAQNVVAGSTVTLNGSASSDANGDALSFAWSLTARPSGSTATLSSAVSALPTFVADLPGTYVASLVVSDGRLASTTATVTVSAAIANVAPVASAGTAQNVVAGSTVTLNGSASSDANGDALSFAWSLTARPSASNASLSSASSALPAFVADLPGTYVASLIVSDGRLVSTTATVAVTAATANVAPVANAGTAQNVVAGGTVTLDGSASSDANGDALSFVWALTARPSGSNATLSSTASALPTFVADLPGTYVASLVVSDGRLVSTTATVTVTAAIANVAPVANAGTAQNVVAGSAVTLNGSASSDANGDALSFAWSLTARPSGSTATLSSTTAAMPTFVADLPGTYVGSLVVSDGGLVSTTATVTVTAISALRMVASTPTEGATPASNAVLPSMTFDTMLDAFSVTAATFELRDPIAPVAGSISTGESATAVFTPAQRLTWGTRYVLKASPGVRSIAGALLSAPVSVGFETAPLNWAAAFSTLSGAPNQYAQPALATGENDTAIALATSFAVRTASGADQSSRVVSFVFDRSTRTWRSAGVVSALTPNPATDYGYEANAPRVAMNGSGDAIAIWAQKKFLPPSTFTPYVTHVARFSAATRSWSTPAAMLATPAPFIAFGQRVTTDGSTGALAVWFEQASGGANCQLASTRYTFSASSWSPVAPLLTVPCASLTVDQLNLIGNRSTRIALLQARSGDAALAFRFNDGRVLAARYSNATQAWSAVETLPNARALSDPTVALSPSGTATIAWADGFDNAASRVVAITAAAGATSWSAPTPLDDWAAGAFAPSGPFAITDRAGNVHVVWTSPAAPYSTRSARRDGSTGTWALQAPLASVGARSPVVDRSGNVSLVDGAGRSIHRFSPASGAWTSAAVPTAYGTSLPFGFDSAGILTNAGEILILGAGVHTALVGPYGLYATTLLGN